MDEGKRNIAGAADPLLQAAAEEELRHACTIGWQALAKVTPWGDTYDGFAAGGLAVTFERNSSAEIGAFNWSTARAATCSLEARSAYE